MGSWTITVKGHGIHHNSNPGDADVLGREFVKRLESVEGTEVSAAELVLTGVNQDGSESLGPVTDLRAPVKP